MKIEIHKDNWKWGRRDKYGYLRKVEAVEIHIMQGTLVGTDAWFGGQNIAAGIYSSSHDGIGKNGDLHEYVAYENTSYHSGRVAQPTWRHLIRYVWGAIANPNFYTYGIECEGYRGDRWTEPQMITLVNRTKYALDKAGLPYTRDRVISHNEIAIDKENMDLWCDEVVRRLNAPINVPQPPNNVEEAKVHLKKALDLLK